MKACIRTSLLGALSLCGCTWAQETWTIESQGDWKENAATQSNLTYEAGKAIPTDVEATFLSVMKRYPKKRSAQTISISQSPEWLNWNPVPNVGPGNLGDAPVALQMGDGNYWMFGRYSKHKSQKDGTFKAEPATLDGFDVELKTSPHKNQFDAPGGVAAGDGGYHAWQSRDMVNWVYHGAITDPKGKWMTTAEYADGKAYFYYDFPNDQDPHLFIDDDLFDGKPGKDMGMAFQDPTHGSDCAFIRDLDGNFHVIAEDWSPIDASTHAWDSPLAVHAVSPDGIGDFKILGPPVDERTKPTGRFAEYVHPHWHSEDPANYPGKTATLDVPQHRVKKGQTRAYGTYEIHEPEQNAYGDWAAISIGGQYYLFADFDPAGGHGRDSMSAAWFTADDINKPFKFCGNIGKGHPDPEILFAEGRFYLLTQMKTDYVSPGPWVESVQVRVGVDTSNDGNVDQWSDWQTVSEQYDYIEGFAKQIAKTAAQMDLSDLPEGYGFQFEVKLTDTTENISKPILDKIVVSFE
ncbi:hypothetical protein PDESU_00320 [Pontiella desulfatans]|uniref:Uncharacterized protein n=1 Tax=Pontiella desulfatans TaxID=2750659 RepID=A0A6C2TW95_PONDE|nr:hypothetical protein [Pontiella desulfatans]VGO11774.1 hypothetical protein PDESU_00320 [Pontiella desulfatans]